MVLCPSCGADNADGLKFCVKCGGELGEPIPSSGPGSWQRPSGNLYDTPGSGNLGGQPGGPVPPPGPNYPTYTPMQSAPYQQQAQAPRQPVHPAIPAIVSLFFPGIGLLFVPNKAGLGILIFVCTVVWNLFVIFLSAFLIGLCLLPISLLIMVGAAIHSYDEAAKIAGGEFKPILFK